MGEGSYGTRRQRTWGDLRCVYRTVVLPRGRINPASPPSASSVVYHALWPEESEQPTTTAVAASSPPLQL